MWVWFAISSPPDFNQGTNSFLCLLLSLSRFLDRHFGFLWRFPLTTRSQTSVPRSPLPVPRFSNIQQPLEVEALLFQRCTLRKYLTWQMVKTGRNARDQIAVCEFHLSYVAFFSTLLTLCLLTCWLTLLELRCHWAKELIKVFACRIRILEKQLHNGHCPLPEWLISPFLNLSCDDDRHPKGKFI